MTLYSVHRTYSYTRLLQILFIYYCFSGVWDQVYWEDDPLYYRCIDPKNEGVVTQPHLRGPTGGEVGDRRVTSQVFKCTEEGYYNTPVQFRNCAPKRKLFCYHCYKKCLRLICCNSLNPREKNLTFLAKHVM